MINFALINFSDLDMQEFDNLIRFCAHRFDTIPFCSNCMMSQCRKCSSNNCYNCLTHIHSIYTTEEHYSCEKITYNYILKHGYRYVSEMAWAFCDLKDSLDLSRPLNIFSVGCGPCTELYGAAAVYKKTPLFYFGFDQSSIWLPLQQFNKENFKDSPVTIEYPDCDFIEFVINNNPRCDILVLNYFLSDFIKYQPQECESFIRGLIALIREGRFSTIIINDVMLLYNTGTGYACMEKIARQLKTNNNISFVFQRRHFAAPNEYQVEYGSKHNNSIGFRPILDEALPFEPFETCGSIQLIIRTIKN